MEHLSSGMEHQNQDQQQVQWRRDKVQELCSKGYSQREISQTLQVGLATVNRDVAYLICNKIAYLWIIVSLDIRGSDFHIVGQIDPVIYWQFLVLYQLYRFTNLRCFSKKR